MSNSFVYEKEFLESIEKTRGLIEICNYFIKVREDSVKRYEDKIKQSPSDHRYKSWLEEAKEKLEEDREALQHYEERLNEELEIYKKYYGRKKTLH